MKRYLGIVVLFSSSKIRISGSPVAQLVKNLSASAGDRKDRDWILGWGRSPGEGNGNQLQYSCLENSMDEEPGRLQSGVAESNTTEHAHAHAVWQC